MPTSNADNIAPILHAVCAVSPKKVLELGIGMGKYGVLLREYLDYAEGRLRRDQWQTEILGVEGYGQYNNPNWSNYDTVLIEDFSKVNYGAFDVVLLIDSLEHLDRGIALDVLKALIEWNRWIIVSVPEGECPQEAVGGNEYERHRSTWTAKDLAQTAMRLGAEAAFTLHKGICSVVKIKGKLQ